MRELDKDLINILEDTRKHRAGALVKEVCEELKSKGKKRSANKPNSEDANMRC